MLCTFDRMQCNKIKSYKDTHKRAILSTILSNQYLNGYTVSFLYYNSIQGKRNGKNN